MTTRIVPTFLLKGIDVNNIWERYLNGEFTRSEPIEKKKIILAQNTAIVAPIYGTTNSSPVFCVKDRNNCSVVIATTGHKDYQVFTSTGGELPVGGRCICGKDIVGQAIGYPVAYQEQVLLTSENKYHTFYTFWTEGRFHSFRCALWYVNTLLARPSDQRDGTYRDSARLLKLLYKLTYPDSTVLLPASDPYLLEENGGSLKEEEWDDTRYHYRRTERVVIIPAKVEYVRGNFAEGVAIN